MLHNMEYHNILEMLRDTYENKPPGYAGKVELEHALKLNANDFVPYLEELSNKGYVKIMEGAAPTFIVKFTEKGYDAYISQGQ